jgi:outer membrane protein assembly factor BamB
MVFAGSYDRSVYALDAASGDLRWAAPASQPIFQVTVAGATVYAESGVRRLYALDAATGRVRWVIGTRRDIIGRPAVAGGSVYVATVGGQVKALDAATGHVRWTHRMQVASGPVVAANTVYLDESPGKLLALDAASGRVCWVLRLEPAGQRVQVVAVDEHVAVWPCYHDAGGTVGGDCSGCGRMVARCRRLVSAACGESGGEW